LPEPIHHGSSDAGDSGITRESNDANSTSAVTGGGSSDSAASKPAPAISKPAALKAGRRELFIFTPDG